jgi:hypothetical protein
MQVLSVSDLDAEESFQILERLRHDCPLKSELESEATLKEVLTITGGRLSFLNRIAREPDMLDTANYMLQNEKAWLLSQIGLIPDCDDDVMDEVCFKIICVRTRAYLLHTIAKMVQLLLVIITGVCESEDRDGKVSEG